jgi:1,4-alpha-glucan branching enzyme
MGEERADTVHFFFFLDNWDVARHPMKRNEFGVFEITIKPVKGKAAIPHNSKVKVRIEYPNLFIHILISSQYRFP